MKVIARNIKWIMIVSGAITSSMLLAAVAPDTALMLTFGESVGGPVANVVVRNWGALIALIGLLLIYAAFHPQYRALSLVLACISKTLFVAFIVFFGSQFLPKAAVAVVFDVVVIVIFVTYLASIRRVE